MQSVQPADAANSPNPAARQAAQADAAHADPARNYAASGFAPGGHRTAPLTLDEQKAIITRGESVLWNNQIIDSHARLPSEAVLALGDPAKEKAAGDKLQAQIHALQGQLDELKSGQLRAPAAPPSVGPGTAPAPQAPAYTHAASPVGLTDQQQAEIKEAQRKALLASQREPAAEAKP